METVEVNGCDFWWDGVWKACCDAHDIDYSRAGDFIDFVNANIKMGSCIWDTGHPLMAIVMTFGVMIGGFFVFRFVKLKGKSLFEIVTGKKY